MGNDTVLTDRQMEILKIRTCGSSQSEIADMFKTTKQNISSIERAARRKIERAENTIKFVKMLKAPVWIVIKENTPLAEIVEKIYTEGDNKNIHAIYDETALTAKVEEDAKGKIRHRKALAKLEIGITGEGDVIIL